MSNPLFSIVIANYNYGRFLETAVRSVLRQCDEQMRLPTGEQIELIVVDGGSTDNSVEVIKKYEGSLAWWCSEKDRGQSHAFNKGFAKTKGLFLTWLNADDVLLPGSLSAVAKEIKRYPDCQWFVGSTIWTDENLKVIRCFRAHRFSVLRANWGTLQVCGPSSFFKKSLLEQVGWINENYNYCMDIELWGRFYFKANQVYRRTTHYVWGFRIHPDSKVGGLDADADSVSARRRRDAMMLEGLCILREQHKTSRVCRVVNLFSISTVDSFLSCIESAKLRGRCLYE